MKREKFVPTQAGNLLIAAWIQFIIKDWFRHGTKSTANAWTLGLDGPHDDWPSPQPQPPLSPPRVMRIADDPSSRVHAGKPPTYVNTVTHWWDGSFMYGTTPDGQRFLRTHERGKLRLEDGYVPLSVNSSANAALVPGFWLGVGMMLKLFVLEHNDICDTLADSHPDFDDEKLFQVARLVNVALIAKIHTTEWTPAVVGHRTTVAGTRGTWYGLFGNQKWHDIASRLSSNEIIAGIPGSRSAQHGVPFALTEEFVAVYRMHQLLPDVFDFRSATDDQPTLGNMELDRLTGPAAVQLLRSNDLGDLMYSFGTVRPGLVTLHNYPDHLRAFKRPDNNEVMDLASIDILRCRELGVPRYAEFRRLLGLKVPKSFGDITSKAEWVKELGSVYETVDDVDLLSGMFAEDLPDGFVFSDTAFRIFVLMASRRLSSDRFFTDSYTEEIYTSEGMAWIDNNTMLTVLERHCPQLRAVLPHDENAFSMWYRSGANSVAPAAR